MNDFNSPGSLVGTLMLNKRHKTLIIDLESDDLFLSAKYFEKVLDLQTNDKLERSYICARAMDMNRLWISFLKQNRNILYKNKKLISWSKFITCKKFKWPQYTTILQSITGSYDSKNEKYEKLSIIWPNFLKTSLFVCNFCNLFILISVAFEVDGEDKLPWEDLPRATALSQQSKNAQDFGVKHCRKDPEFETIDIGHIKIPQDWKKRKPHFDLSDCSVKVIEKVKYLLKKDKNAQFIYNEQNNSWTINKAKTGFKLVNKEEEQFESYENEINDVVFNSKTNKSVKRNKTKIARDSKDIKALFEKGVSKSAVKKAAEKMGVEEEDIDIMTHKDDEMVNDDTNWTTQTVNIGDDSETESDDSDIKVKDKKHVKDKKNNKDDVQMKDISEQGSHDDAKVSGGGGDDAKVSGGDDAKVSGAGSDEVQESAGEVQDSRGGGEEQDSRGDGELQDSRGDGDEQVSGGGDVQVSGGGIGNVSDYDIKRNLMRNMENLSCEESLTRESTKFEYYPYSQRKNINPTLYTTEEDGYKLKMCDINIDEKNKIIDIPKINQTLTSVMESKEQHKQIFEELDKIPIIVAKCVDLQDFKQLQEVLQELTIKSQDLLTQKPNQMDERCQSLLELYNHISNTLNKSNWNYDPTPVSPEIVELQSNLAKIKDKYLKEQKVVEEIEKFDKILNIVKAEEAVDSKWYDFTLNKQQRILYEMMFYQGVESVLYGLKNHVFCQGNEKNGPFDAFWNFLSVWRHLGDIFTVLTNALIVHLDYCKGHQSRSAIRKYYQKCLEQLKSVRVFLKCVLNVYSVFNDCVDNEARKFITVDDWIEMLIKSYFDNVENLDELVNFVNKYDKQLYNVQQTTFRYLAARYGLIRPLSLKILIGILAQYQSVYNWKNVIKNDNEYYQILPKFDFNVIKLIDMFSTMFYSPKGMNQSSLKFYIIPDTPNIEYDTDGMMSIHYYHFLKNNTQSEKINVKNVN